MVAAIALQLVPLPPALLSFLSPKAETVRSAIVLSRASGTIREWAPLSLAPTATAYAFLLVCAGLIVFWTARQLCAQGSGGSLVHAIALIGLLASVVAIVQRAGEAHVIYGFWTPREQGA